MLNFGDKRPPCAMDCGRDGMVLIGRRFFCGPCAVEYQKIKERKEQMTIMEEMKRGKDN